MRRKKKFTSALSFVLSLLMSFSCIQPVMATQTVPDVESVSGEAAAQAEGNEDTNVSVSAAPAKEETSEAPAESTENTPIEETAPAETTESTQEEVVSEPAAEEPQPTKVLSFENTKDKLSVELTKESDFDPGSTADIHLLKDNAYKDLVENLKKSLEAKNKGYTVSLDTLLAAEVNVLDEDGNKKDAGKVSTKIFTDASALKDSVLYHQKEDQTWEEIQFETAEDASYVTFDAEKLGNFVFAKADLAKKEELETSFSYKDKTVTITAKATEEAGLKKGTKLCAVALEKGSKEYKDAVKKVEESVGLKEGQTLHFKPYDVYFEYKGEKIEPQDGTVKIAMTFKEKIFQDVTESTPVERSFVAHIKDNGDVEQLTDTSAKEKKVAFDVESFSVMGPALLSTDPEISPLADTDAYAILYDSGELVFQRGSAPDASKGTVLKTYTGFETEKYTGYPYAPWYENKTSIKAVSFKDVVKPVSTSYWFYECKNLTDVDFTNLDTSAVTSMRFMFKDCSSLTSLDVSSFDTKAVTSMYYMFEGCSSLTSLDLSSFNTSAVTNMDYMFYDCEALTSLDVSSFDTSAVTGMDSMFVSCSSLKSLDVSSFDTSAVTNMHSMFQYCEALTSLDLSSFNTSAVTDMHYMFYHCKKLTSLDVSSFDTSAVTDMSGMFESCGSLTSLDVSSFDTSAVTDMGDMFYDCEALTSLDVSSFDTSAVTNMDYMFYDCRSLTSLDVSSFNTSAVTSMDGMFQSCSSLTSLDLSSFNTSAVTNMHSMFQYCRSLTSLDLSSFNTSAVTDMDCMFYQCRSLKSLDVGSFDTSKVTNMDYMFYDCNALETLTLGTKFAFKGDADLIDATWHGINTGNEYTTSVLTSTYNGPTMADTYARITDITFNAVGGKSSFKTVNGYVGMTLNSLPTAEKEGYDFVGWFTQKQGGTQFLVNQPITQSTYYAQYTDHNYNLVLKANGPKDMADITKTLKYSEIYHLSEDAFTYEGHVLTGWNTRKDGSGESYDANDDILNMSTEDGSKAILYAQWTLLSDYATVTFDTQGGSEMAPLTVKKGSQLGDTVPQYKNHKFINWHKDSLTGDVINSTAVINESMTLYAEWKENPIVTFDSGGISLPIQKRVEYGSTVGTLPKFAPNVNMYKTLIGWFTKPTGGTQITTLTPVTENVTYYAQWGWQPRFNTNGGKITSDTAYPTQANSNYTITTLPTAVRDGYTFNGWYLSDGATKLKDGDTVDLSLGVEIVAHWTNAGTITVTFDKNGGSLDSSLTTLKYYKGEAFGSLPTPTRNSSYVFKGWYNGDTRYDENSIAETDITLTAKWAQKVHTVTFNPGHGTMNSSSKTQKIADGDTIQTLPGAKLTNYIHRGWYTGKNGTGEKLTTTTPITSDMTYYAYYEEMATTSSDAEQLYTFGAEWSNPSNTNVDNMNDHLEFHPSDCSNQTAMLHLKFELNQSIGDEKIPAEAIQIRVPKYVWKNWDGESIGTNNISANLPLYPDTKAGMFFSYKEDGDDYVILNNRELSGGTGIELTITYTVSPWDVPGGAMTEDGTYVDGYNKYVGTVPVSVEVDKDKSGTMDVITNKELSLEMNTKVENSGLSTAQMPKIYYQWDSSWGDKPNDAENYFYIMWNPHTAWQTNTSQPFSCYYSEDSVHDGTVVRYNFASDNGSNDLLVHTYNTKLTSSKGCSDFILVKYPIELIKNIPESGLVLRNQVTLNTDWKSGYHTEELETMTYTLYDNEDTQQGTFTKDNGYYTTTKAEPVNGGQEDILDDNKNVSMDWYESYDGIARSTPAVWNEETQTYTAKERTIAITDGQSGDLIYSSGDNAAKYVWEPASGNESLLDSDYNFTKLNIRLTEYDARQEDGIWTQPYRHEDINDYSQVKIYLRYKNSDTFEYWKSAKVETSGNKKFALPNNVVGYKVTVDSTFYSTYLSAQGTISLHSTKHVRSLIQNDVNAGTTSIIKNIARCEIWDTDDEAKNVYYSTSNYTGGLTNAIQVCYELNTSETTQMAELFASSVDNTTFDSQKGTQDNPIYMAGWNYNTSKRMKKVKTGTFYNLLPAGTTVDVSTIFGIPMNYNDDELASKADDYEKYKADSSKLDSGYFDVRFIDNYEDSGRTMMIIKFATPENVTANGMQFWYKLHSNYENIMQAGTTLENDVAFVNTTGGAVLPKHTVGTQDIVSESQYYDKIQAENAGLTSYAIGSTNYVLVDATSWGFSKYVKAQTEYETSATTLPNNDYVYKLSYSQSDSTKSSGLVFYDVLEYGANRKDNSGNNVFNKSQWHGTFKNINVSSIAEKLTDGSTDVYCNPVVYYSTKDRATFTEADYDVTNTAVWSVNKPEDVSTITAVAIDCSKNADGTDFVMNGKQAVDLTITMTAPSSADAHDKTAYNEAVIYAKKNADTTATPTYSNADITIKNVDPTISKTANPGSGTLDARKGVFKDTELDYTVSVTNSDDTYTLTDIVTEDTVPAGLNIDPANIQVFFGDKQEGTAKNVAVTFDGSSKTESVSYDYVELFYILNGITYSAGKFGGSDIAGKTIVLPTTDFYLYWKTDSSSDDYYGYKATVTPTNDAAITGTVTSLPSGVTVKEAASASDLESKHGNYGNNVKELWHYTETDLTIPVKGIPITESPRVSLEKSGQNLKFKISTLLPGETINFIIPTLITGSIGTELTNTATITSVNNVTKDLKSDTTYHKIVEEVNNATITVSKTVAGTMGDKTKDFTFQLKMTGNTPAEIPYTKGEETGTLAVVDGVAEFTLSHGENIVLSEIPIGTAYEITEVDGASNGYTVESTNSSGTLTEDTNVSFTNTRNGTVPTSAHTNILISIGVFAIALAGLFWHLRKRKQ